MVYTEMRVINKKKYYYRVISIRKLDKISKKRVYLGLNLSKSELFKKEKSADEILKKPNKELERIKPKIIKILKENNIKQAGIFGSYSRGEQKKDSDIDIVVKIEDKNMSLIGFARLINTLEKNLKKKIDLVEYEALKPRIKKRILAEEIRIL